MKKNLLLILLFNASILFSQSGHDQLDPIPLDSAPGYNFTPNYLQNGESNMPDSNIKENDRAVIFINFDFDTTDDEVFVVYTTDNTSPTKTNGNVLSATFFDFENPNRVWNATIPGQSGGEMIRYVIYSNSLNDGSNNLANANNRISPSGFQTSWTEGDSFFTTTVITQPITLQFFDVSVDNSIAELSWKTLSEVDFSHFEIQRSFNGLDFETITEIESKGGFSNDYFYSDNLNNVLARKVYYRLIAVDLDRSSEAFSIQSVQLQFPKSEDAFFFNNGIKQLQTLNSSECLEGEVEIYNINGVVSKNMPFSNCSQSSIDLSELTRGMYVALWKTENRTYNLKFSVF